VSTALAPMTAEDLLSLADSALSAAGEGEVEVVAKAVRRGFARFAMGDLGQHMNLTELLLRVRVARGARVAEASTNRFDRDAVIEAIRAAAKAADKVPETEGFTGFTRGDEPTGASPPRFAARTVAIDAEGRVDRLIPVLNAVAKAGLVSAGALETRVTSLAVATTRGRRLSHDSTAAHFKVWALETPGAGGAAGHGGQSHRDVDALDLEGETARAIRICKMGKNPGSLDAGTYDVVMEPPAVSELIEWLSTIAASAPEVEQGTSPFSGRIGELVTGETITLTEDPLDDSPLGLAAPFDREGVWRKRVPLIERGVARGILHDRASAARMGASSTGSSLIAEGEGASVGACAVHLSPGEAASVDELIAGVQRGLYICRLHYVNGLLEPRRAVMTGLTRDGCFLIEKGKISRPVGNMRFTDSFLEGLARSDGMTRARSAIPTWWSDAGATVVPAIRMRAFRFNGKSQERLG
jgi:PmbA protein